MREKTPACSLSRVRADMQEYCGRLRDRGGCCGAYRMAPRARCDLYSSCDVAILRTITGEDLENTPGTGEREEWRGHINSFAKHDFERPADGGYCDTMGHSQLHANGMVIGALGVPGGKQAQPELYEPFDRPEKAGPWLASLDWSRAWQTLHLFWGGVHCFSFSARASAAWLDAVFGWLDANLDHKTGWWRAGVAFADRHQGLGGAAHLLPLYGNHGRRFPLPERVIDSVLAMQLPHGSWLEPRNRSV
jgi:hypothetical protein